MKRITKLLDRDLEGIDEKNLLDEVKKQRDTFFFLVVLLLCLLVIFLTVSTYLNEVPESQIENYFSTQYSNEYYLMAEEEIQSILVKSETIPDPIDKLTAIATWEIDNFTNDLEYLKWNKSYNGTQKINADYIYDEDGRIRAVSGKYQNDPHWIAYHKIGACGELTALFGYVVNRSGFETRKVWAEYADNFQNHAWVEVKINGEWMYFDPTIYWNNHYNRENITRTEKWYGSLDEQNLWGVLALGVYDKETGKDVCAERYYNINQVNRWIVWYYDITRKANYYLNALLNK
ncbi:transglutaminase domain-containing protein [Methanorbis rubei]